MGFSIGFVAFGTYLGTMGGMVSKYYKVKRFFREQAMEMEMEQEQELLPHNHDSLATNTRSKSDTLNLNDEL